MINSLYELSKSLDNVEFINNNCIIYRTNENVENNIIFCYLFTDENELIKIRLNEDISRLIFLYGLLNCMSHNLDSSYTFDTIEDKDSEVGQEYLKLFADESFFPKNIMNTNKYVVISHQFNIKNISCNKVCIEYSSKYGFITGLYDEYRKFSRKKYNFKVELEYKEIFDIMKFINSKL